MSKRAKTKEPEIMVPGDSPFAPIIEQAYEVFKGSKPGDTETCECCMDHRIRKDFFNHAPQDIPLYYVQDWFFGAVDYPISKGLWRFLLPRILEILACKEDPAMVALEVSLSRFPTGDQSQWTDQEWSVLDRFQRLYLKECEAVCPGTMADDVLCMFALAGWPADDLFEQVFDWPEDKLIRKLEEDWLTWGGHGGSVWVTAFWDDEQKARELWSSPKLEKRLLDIAMNDQTQPERAAVAFRLCDVLLDNRKIVGR